LGAGERRPEWHLGFYCNTSNSLVMYQPHNDISGDRIVALALALVAGILLAIHALGT
jgi:hypothetical protein